jgi:subtilase-type serine protease
VVITNNGAIAVTGADSAGVELNGAFGTLLNAGSITAAPGAYAISTGPSASGSVIVSTGLINGLVAISSGANVRFENSGWLGINAPGAGATHTIGGTFVQTSTEDRSGYVVGVKVHASPQLHSRFKKAYSDPG